MRLWWNWWHDVVRAVKMELLERQIGWLRKELKETDVLLWRVRDVQRARGEKLIMLLRKYREL